MKVLLVAPNIDATDVGEAYVAFKWAEALSELVDLTVLAFQQAGRQSVELQLPKARVVTWREPAWVRKHERLNGMLKPAWPILSKRVKHWIRDAMLAGENFDIAHQLMPQAARYASPLRHFECPYIIGPLGGALQTPCAFRKEASSAPMYTRLRALDRFRFRHDPALRASYMRASCVLGVAPYVEDVLADIPLRRFEPLLELGIDTVEPAKSRVMQAGQLRVLHVGRGVRTKGLRDTVRALARLDGALQVTLTSAGAGEEIDVCRNEARRLGVTDRVTFLGRVPRADIEELYAGHDVFCFPSFREPAGGVLYEAMRHGLPIVTADRGGPAWIVDDTAGLKVPVTDPDRYAHDIALALQRLAVDLDLREKLGTGARAKVEREGLWPRKAAALVDLYRDILASEIAPRRYQRIGYPILT